jgi:hypothetical protein
VLFVSSHDFAMPSEIFGALMAELSDWLLAMSLAEKHGMAHGL